MTTSTSKKRRQGRQEIGWPQAIRDVLIASMNRGQFPLAIGSLIVIVLILKLPPEDVSRLVSRIADDLYRGQMIAYPALLVVTGGWYAHAKSLRRAFNDEISRLSAARTEAQRAKLGGKVKSSER